MRSIDEAILIGEAATLSEHVSPYLFSISDTMTTEIDVGRVKEINGLIINKLEAALLINPTNFDTLYSLFLICSYGYKYLTEYELNENELEFYRLKIFNYSYMLLDHSAIDGYETIESDCYYELAYIFCLYYNYSAALKYSKIAYEHCLRSSNHTDIANFKDSYVKYRAAFAELPPLRFSLGDEVEFLHELETGSEWRLGKVVELYYRERDFEITFSAPYRLQLLNDNVREPSEYAWVKADIDRCVRKVGVRSIEDTRYKIRLDAKVEELARVYCSEEFMQDIYNSLAQDREFVDMLESGKFSYQSILFICTVC